MSPVGPSPVLFVSEGLLMGLWAAAGSGGSGRSYMGRSTRLGPDQRAHLPGLPLLIRTHRIDHRFLSIRGCWLLLRLRTGGNGQAGGSFRAAQGLCIRDLGLSGLQGRFRGGRRGGSVG